ncbi:class I SAM-dependent methyltransferase [Marmoricola sp. RAF53]|uniref:class I SAM-dependent methyltransferase n=1 Tax=Marmoricola sp. RAF53 TaxID=3233059 RepID=UPI003F98A982
MNQTLTADAELKQKHRTMWAWGDYPRLTVDVISPLGPTLVEAAGVAAGQRVLDVAAGSGNASIPAARTGAEVVASDLTPELLAAGEAHAREAGVTLGWQVADAENLPYDDAAFDTVLSCVGVMFAPHHQEAADELARVTRPGGTIGLLSWTPSGFIGQMFATMKPYAPPPPPGAQPPPLWGDRSHVEGLFGDRVTEVRTDAPRLVVDAFETPEAFRDYFKACYGPTIAVYKNIAADPDRVASLDDELADLARDHWNGGRMEWEYLLFTARRA